MLAGKNRENRWVRDFYHTNTRSKSEEIATIFCLKRPASRTQHICVCLKASLPHLGLFLTPLIYTARNAEEQENVSAKSWLVTAVMWNPSIQKRLGTWGVWVI
ncbi:Bgt-20423 [Blumeria graminis f. sp. tritici]|uniref:Bgt-20423 n=2 Tax=Blumeria graminis f. sp. tritici TaxID=62690 RepID=A0A9X9PQL3_BLUGR|nr:Bgt-20423 [Blumeria graminis f. sp. tritici]